MIAMPIACVVDATVGIKLVISEALSEAAQDHGAHATTDHRRQGG
jgi:hypothetical protein